ncbi:MAG: LysR family transcriptional regulator [Boseongicola sp.]|nr:MAG: LysR family transcriptional regulator [Boseongicola sp.]
MNWDAVNFDWNQVRAFLATLEEGSLSAAARSLGLTQPTLGRQVAALEDRLDVTLFERAGRELIPTPAALEMAEHVRAMGEAATRFSLVATGQSQSVEGVVKITATEMFAAQLMPDLVAELRTTHPGIILEVIATNSLSDLRRREADIAVRNADPTDPDLIARRMSVVRVLGTKSCFV